MQARSSSLRLGIRKDEDERDVDIRLTFKSLILVFWLGIGIVLIYEIIFTMALLLRKRIVGRRHNQEARPHDTNDISGPSVPLYLSSIWGISTAYAIFYSFEVVFLYVNDGWLPLLPVQLMFTFTDVYVWLWMVGHLKYRLWGKASPYAKACVLIKFSHVAFNILVEKGFWMIRHWLFCLEDLVCLAMAQEVYGFSVLQMRKEMVFLGFIIWISATALSTVNRVT